MTRSFLGVVAVAAFAAQAAVDAHQPDRPAIDAFLSRREVKPLPDVRGLSPIARDALVNGRVSTEEPRLGVPTFFWSSRQPGVRSYRSMGLSASQAARRYLLAHAELYRGVPARWAEARISGEHDLGDKGAVIVTFQQDVRGVRVFRDELKVVMSSELELVALAGYLTPEVKPTADFQLSMESAIASAFQSMTGRGLEVDQLKPLGPTEGGYVRFALRDEPTPVRARPVYFPLPEGLEPGFYVELELSTAGTDADYFSFVISAKDGAVLYRKNLTANDSYTYRVWANDADPLKIPLDGPQGQGPTPHPTGAPNSYAPPFVASSLITLANGPISTMDPWLPMGATTTAGNNVNACADIIRPNGCGSGDVVPSTTAALTFDRTYDPAVNPDTSSTQQMAAVTQLFYNDNFFHDWYYDVGFDERAGNAQLSNFSRGGLQNDVLRAEAQDYSGRNNANMSTPSDGASPRMQMYIFDGASNLTLTVNTSPSQTFGTAGANFGPQAFNVTGELVVANDGNTTNGSSLTDACTAAWPTAVTGKIVLIDRGTCTFISKVQNAQANGAIGVIIADNVAGSTPPDLYGQGTTTIPAVSVTRANGALIRGSPAGTTVTLSAAASVDRDGTIDNAIVAHEWGHYISNRLIGDGNGISNNQARGMGEGWSDFHAMLMVVQASDLMVPANANWAGVYGLAGYTSAATDANGYYFGIRRVPYSTDMTKNGLTFKHIANGNALPSSVPTAFGASGTSNAEVHNTGEVWATMLWECYAALLRDPRYTFDQARDRMRSYLVAAYKATPLMPTFVDARDAILAVAAARDVQDFAAFWTAFAKRGMGMQAVAPDRDSQTNSPVVESFMVGNTLTITEVKLDDLTRSCDMDGNLDAKEDGNLTITIKNIGIGNLASTTATVSTTTPGLSFPMGATATFPTSAPFGTATVKLPVSAANLIGIQGASFQIIITDPSLLSARGVSKDALFRVNFDAQQNGSATDDVEAPMSLWTSASDPNGNTGSNFRVFQSSATEHWWFGPNPASPADTWLISPDLNVGTNPFVITFKHRYDFEKDATTNYDGAVIEISSDGGSTWTDIGASAMPGYPGQLSGQGSNPLRGKRAYVGRSANYPTFNTETVSLGTAYSGKTVKLRFRIGADDAAAAKGWEIDDVAFAGITNKPFTTVIGDPNTCTNRAPVVTLGPDQEVFENDLVTLNATASDPDGDMVTQTWTQTSGPMVTVTGNTFTAPRVDADTMLTFEVVVSDGRAMVGPLTQKVLVKNGMRAPVASVPAVIEVREGEVATVVGTGTDADGDVLTYSWKQVSGPTVALRGDATDTVQFDAPQVEADTVVALELTVADPALSSAPARVEVVVRDSVAVNPLLPNQPKGCGGCTTGIGDGLAPLMGLLALLRARRRR